MKIVTVRWIGESWKAIKVPESPWEYMSLNEEEKIDALEYQKRNPEESK